MPLPHLHCSSPSPPLPHPSSALRPRTAIPTDPVLISVIPTFTHLPIPTFCPLSPGLLNLYHIISCNLTQHSLAVQRTSVSKVKLWHSPPVRLFAPSLPDVGVGMSPPAAPSKSSVPRPMTRFLQDGAKPRIVCPHHYAHSARDAFVSCVGWRV